MKKTILLIALLITISIFSSSCSSDDTNNTEDCEIKVYGYGITPNGDGTNSYSLNYGTNNTDAPVYTVNFTTYNYYISLINETGDAPCWEGPK